MHVIQAMQVSCAFSLSFIYLFLMILFCRQGQGCAKQEKILTGEHSMLCHHAVALHLVCSHLCP